MAPNLGQAQSVEHKTFYYELVVSGPKIGATYHRLLNNPYVTSQDSGLEAKTLPHNNKHSLYH